MDDIIKVLSGMKLGHSNPFQLVSTPIIDKVNIHPVIFKSNPEIAHVLSPSPMRRGRPERSHDLSNGLDKSSLSLNSLNFQSNSAWDMNSIRQSSSFNIQDPIFLMRKSSMNLLHVEQSPNKPLIEGIGVQVLPKKLNRGISKNNSGAFVDDLIDLG